MTSATVAPVVATVELPPGRWRDVLSDREVTTAGGGVPLAELLADRPVALLVRQPVTGDPT